MSGARLRRDTFIPSHEAIANEHRRIERARFRMKILAAVLCLVIVFAAVGVLLDAYVVTVVTVEGVSMEPAFSDGQRVLVWHTQEVSQGDVIVFYWQNLTVIKRVIACPGDTVDIDEDGTVYVNGEALQESYIAQGSLAPTDITYPYLVGDGEYFVMGDNRAQSIDSRSSEIGCVSAEKILGRVG